MRPTFWTDDRIEDMQFMWEMGEHPERIAHRLGVSLAALERVARREGLGDLAAEAATLRLRHMSPESRARRNRWRRDDWARKRAAA